MNLSGKVVVLNGASGLLGQALSTRLAAEGVAGLALGDLRIDALTDEADRLPCEALVREIDVRRQESVSALVDAALQQFGKVDVVINNAGVLSPSGRIHNIDDDVWHTAFDVNVLGCVHGIRAAVDAMRSRGGGSIINTASVAGLTVWPYAAPYAVTKAAVVHLTKVAAAEYAKDGIRVNCVCPGVFPSAMHDGLDDDVMANLSGKHPLGLGSPEGIVGAFVYLASDAASWTTGTALLTDGGYAIH